MHIEFDLKLRYRMPEPRDRTLQNLYFFNLYRAGSSMVEAIGESLAQFSGRTPHNLSRELYGLGVEYFDSQNLDGSSVHLAEGEQLSKLTRIGGYLYYGFREVPRDFAEAFRHIGASILIVRDPRDIGISQYKAVAGHATDNRILATQIESLREQAESMDMGEFLLRDDNIAFLRRIVMSYQPMIQKRINVLHYEDMYIDGNLNLRLLCETIVEHMERFLPDSFDFEKFFDNVQRRIENSKALKGHATGGSIYNYTKLDPGLLDDYTAKLRDAIDLLEY
jgi:hypothetical protein